MKYNETYIVEQYQLGRTAKDIGLELGTYNTTIRRILIRNNVSLRGVSYTLRTVKESPLTNLNYYWLGWLATDGCLTNGYIVLELQDRDRYIVEEFAKWAGCNVLSGLYRNKFKTARAQFKNKEAYEHLIALGITPRKSKTLKVNFDLNWDFIRGAFDGDGSFNNGFTIMSASEEFIKQIYNFYIEEGFKPTITRNRVLYCVNLYGYTQLKALYKRIYSDNCLCLKRKRDKMVTFIRKDDEKFG